MICYSLSFFFFNDTATTEIYTLSLHDALPILQLARGGPHGAPFLRPRRLVKRIFGRVRWDAANRRHAGAVCRRARFRPGPGGWAASDHQQRVVPVAVAGGAARDPAPRDNSCDPGRAGR